MLRVIALGIDSSGPMIDVGSLVTRAVVLATGSGGLVAEVSILLTVRSSETCFGSGRQSHRFCCWFR